MAPLVVQAMVMKLMTMVMAAAGPGPNSWNTTKLSGSLPLGGVSNVAKLSYGVVCEHLKESWQGHLASLVTPMLRP